jgi:hypothetical protein
MSHTVTTWRAPSPRTRQPACRPGSTARCLRPGGRVAGVPGQPPGPLAVPDQRRVRRPAAAMYGSAVYLLLFGQLLPGWRWHRKRRRLGRCRGPDLRLRGPGQRATARFAPWSTGALRSYGHAKGTTSGLACPGRGGRRSARAPTTRAGNRPHVPSLMRTRRAREQDPGRRPTRRAARRSADSRCSRSMTSKSSTRESAISTKILARRRRGAMTMSAAIPPRGAHCPSRNRCVRDDGFGQGRMGPFLRCPYGPLGLFEEYAGTTEDVSRTGFQARVVFGDSIFRVGSCRPGAGFAS